MEYWSTGVMEYCHAAAADAGRGVTALHANCLPCPRGLKQLSVLLTLSTQSLSGPYFAA
jgi:hypothetical protein